LPKQESFMADCPKCGRENPAGTSLCANCGESLPDEPTPNETAGVLEPSADESDNEVLRLLRSGNKIAAIKACRAQTRLGLREAKETVEALAAEHGIVSKPSGCAGVVLLAILIGTGLAAYVCCSNVGCAPRTTISVRWPSETVEDSTSTGSANTHGMPAPQAHSTVMIRGVTTINSSCFLFPDSATSPPRIRV
jgi:hypothetical protein